MHVLEAVIAAVLLFGFMLAVMPSETSDTNTGATVNTMVYNILSSLDNGDALRDAAVNQDLGRIDQQVSQYMSGHGTNVALTSLNTTYDRARFADFHDTVFPSTDTAERETLRLWFWNADAPTVTVNGNTVYSTTGTLQDAYRTVDIAAETVDGTNTLNISVDSASFVGYSVDRVEHRIDQEPPGSAEVTATAYTLAGVNDTFAPQEVTVLSWQ